MTFCHKCRDGYVVEYDTGKCYEANFSHCSLVGFDSGRFECWDCEDKYTVDIVTWQRCFLDCKD